MGSKKHFRVGSIQHCRSCTVNIARAFGGKEDLTDISEEAQWSILKGVSSIFPEYGGKIHPSRHRKKLPFRRWLPKFLQPVQESARHIVLQTNRKNAFEILALPNFSTLRRKTTFSAKGRYPPHNALENHLKAAKMYWKLRNRKLTICKCFVSDVLNTFRGLAQL